jgi:hypothetical protein
VLTRKVGHTTRPANTAFEESASQLEELGYVHEITSDGVTFSRSEPDVGDHNPESRIAAAAFLGLTGAVDLGSLDQAVGVAAYKGFHRCPALFCPKGKGKGEKSTYYKLCANPSKFHTSTRVGGTSAGCTSTP